MRKVRFAAAQVVRSAKEPLRSVLSGVLLSVMLAGCATIPGASHELLSFLRVGETTRVEVLLNLGQPSASFEQERILTYRIGEDSRQGQYVVSPNMALGWQQVRYSLVLVFDQNSRLEKQKLIPVR